MLLDGIQDLKQLNLWTAKKLLQWHERLLREERTRIALEEGGAGAEGRGARAVGSSSG